MPFLKALGNFYLYSSLHISLCAGLLTIESYKVLDSQINFYFVLFISLATMSVYSVHRLIGMDKVKAFADQGRYKVIRKFKNHILVYFLLSTLASLYFLYQLDYNTLLSFIIPFFLTALYVIPVFKKGKRLRDLAFIKIFIIAFVWAWMTWIIPAEIDWNTIVLFLFIERILFFIAITIPFDIRDLEVDKTVDVKTLVHVMKLKGSKYVAISLLAISFFIISYLLFQNLIANAYWIALSISYLIAGILIWYSNQKKGDWYYSGLIDGLIGIRIILLCLFSMIG